MAHTKGMDAFQRHKKYMSDYVRLCGRSSGASGTHSGSSSVEGIAQAAPVRTDHDILKESFRFIRSELDDADHSWEQQLAKKYYDKLFKEYCLADMSRYKESKIGLRWRTQREVLDGKGQFICGAKGCDAQAGLHSFEVNFAYMEAGERKHALVKLRLCPKHGTRLSYKKEKEMQRKRRREEKAKSNAAGRRAKRKKHHNSSDSACEGDSEGQNSAEQGLGREATADASCGAQAEGMPSERPGGSWEKNGEEIRAAGTGTGLGNSGNASSLPGNVWARQPQQAEATREEEFDDYFQDLLL